jgi:hypothetical protein
MNTRSPLLICFAILSKPLAAAMLATGCTPINAQPSCTDDEDCRGPRVCSAGGSCVWPEGQHLEDPDVGVGPDAGDGVGSREDVRGGDAIVITDTGAPDNGAPDGDLVDIVEDPGCPTAVATATIDGRDSAPATFIRTIPGATIQFDGAGSSDPDGDSLLYQWTILSRPAGSTAALSPNIHEPAPTLNVAVAGEYRVELTVIDSTGLASCGEPAVVTIDARPESDIYIELVWATPNDPDPLDNSGSDVDLHYLHPYASEWNSTDWDIFYAHKTADWGLPGDDSDNPSMNTDDTNGFGPEAISHSGLESVFYKVGVNYFNDWGYGSSRATIRVYSEGVLSFEIADKFLTLGQFWQAAIIDGETLEVIPVDRVTGDFP